MAKLAFTTSLAHFREEASSNRDLGDRFERLICRYLELDPIYAERFSRVWMWNEVAAERTCWHVGIDLVAEGARHRRILRHPVQVLPPRAHDAKEDIDSFFTASGKELFTSCMIVSTTDRWGKNAEHAASPINPSPSRGPDRSRPRCQSDRFGRSSASRPQDRQPSRAKETPRRSESRALPT